MRHKPTILIVLDGWGYSEEPNFNAINSAEKPAWDKYWQSYPHTLISASGTDVGLPDKQMGNSEVGHMNIGSGRVVDQDFTRITRAIEDGSFYKNETLRAPIEAAVKNGKSLHILGLLSPGGVHSHQDHIFSLIELGTQCGLKNIYLHAFLDGRDTPPASAKTYIEDAEAQMEKLGAGKIVSLIGRYYAMDRNNNWDRIEIAYDLLRNGKSEYKSDNAVEAIESAYARGETDEFVKATTVVSDKNSPICIEDGDVVVFANYRADRARLLSQAFTDKEFDAFKRSGLPKLEAFISVTEYKAEFDFPVAFPPERLTNGFGEYVSKKGLHQLRIAETEKYAHVTFFFNGGEESVFENEDRILVPSPNVATYDLQPEMNAVEVTDKMIEAVESDKYDAIICNFANADMVGHTGNFSAAVKAIETLDQCLDRIICACLKVGGELLITADHGNAEQMRTLAPGKEAQPHTAHTNNLVPFLFVSERGAIMEQAGLGALCDIAPTMLYLMGLEQPSEMTGKPLLTLQEKSIATA